MARTGSGQSWVIFQQPVCGPRVIPHNHVISIHLVPSMSILHKMTGS